MPCLKKMLDDVYKRFTWKTLKKIDGIRKSNINKYPSKNYSGIIRKMYLEILGREPDEAGFNYYLSLMEKNEFDEQKLRDTLRDSDEYKRKKAALLHDMKRTYIFKGLYDISYVIHPNSVLDNIVVKDGIYDRWVTSKLKELIPDTGTIFDVGANVGLLSLPFAKHYVSKGLVYAFEPDSEIINQLKENVKINKLENIIVEQIALQDDPSINKITFYRRQAIHDDGLRNNGISTICLNPTYNVGKEVVPASTLDLYIKKRNFTNIDLIKIDVEGAEFRVLLGSSKTIDAFHPIIIYEYSATIDNLTNFQNSRKTFELLKKKGYKQYQIIDNERLSEMNEDKLDIPDSNIICFHESKTPMW